MPRIEPLYVRRFIIRIKWKWKRTYTHRLIIATPHVQSYFYFIIYLICGHKIKHILLGKIHMLLDDRDLYYIEYS